MSTLASERSWLLNPALLKLVHQCRRLIRNEFGVKLHLTEERLEQQLADYASKTRSTHLAKTWETLKPQIPNLELDEPAVEKTKEASPKRMYRGQAIADEPARETAEESGDGATTQRKQRVYRGQVVG